MSKFILTNSKEKLEIGLSNFLKRGLKVSGRFSLSGVYFISFHKRGYDDENIVFFENNFVCSIGTFIYQGRQGSSALNLLYNNFSDNFKEIQLESVLQGTIIIKKGSDIHVFCDKYNVHWTYYSKDKESFYISSSLSNVVESLDKKILLMDRFLEAKIQRGSMGNEMFYKGIKRLFGNQEININTKGEFYLKQYDYEQNRPDLSGASESEIIKFFSEAYFSVLENLVNAFNGEIAIHQSGGLDSRLILAGFLHLGYKPKLIYGLGNTPLTSQYYQDKIIIDKICKKYALNSYLMNWSINGNMDVSQIVKSFHRYGFNCNENYCNENWYKEYLENIGLHAKLLLDGHMGETLNIEGEDKIFNGIYPEVFSMDYLFEMYQNIFFTNFIWRSNDRKKSHIDYLKSELSQLTDSVFKLPHSGDSMSIKDYQSFWWLRYRPADAHPTNLFNEFFSSLSPLGISKLHDITLNIPFNLIKNRGLSIKLIDSWVPGLNDVGLFSRATRSRIKDGKIIRSGGRAQEVLMNLHRITPNAVVNAYRMGKNLVQKQNKVAIDPLRDFYVSQLKYSPLNEIFDFTKQKGDVRALATAFIYWKSIEVLGYDSIE
jgi:hypothetical protein